MKRIARLGWVLGFAVAAQADLDWSGWKHTDLGSAAEQIRIQGVDDRFEYRWRSGWNDTRSVCSVEIRSSGSSLVIPEVAIVYSPNRRLRTVQVLTGSLSVADCAGVEAVISGRPN
jgi:hypothetical protein